MEAVDTIKETDIPLKEPLSFYSNIGCTIPLLNNNCAIQTIIAQLLLILAKIYKVMIIYIRLYSYVLPICKTPLIITFNVHSSIFNLSEVASSKVCIFAH